MSTIASNIMQAILLNVLAGLRNNYPFVMHEEIANTVIKTMLNHPCRCFKNIFLSFLIKVAVYSLTVLESKARSSAISEDAY